MNTLRLPPIKSVLDVIGRLHRRIAATAYFLAILTASKVYGQQVTVDVGNNITLQFFGQGDTVAGYATNNTGTQNWTNDQIDAVVRSAQMWDNVIDNAAGRRVTIAVLWDDTLDSHVNGVNSSQPTGQIIAGNHVTFAELVWRHGQNDAPAAGADTRIAMNPDRNWVFGVARPDVHEHDFASTIAHEIGHGLGFSARASTDTSDPDNPQFDGFLNPLNAYTRLLRDNSNNTPIEGQDAAFPNQMVGTGPSGSTVFWTGTRGNDLFGSDIPIATFNDWRPSSSLSHTFLPETIMHRSRGTGTMSRALLPHEIGMLEDMGWAVSANYLDSYADYWYTDNQNHTFNGTHTSNIYAGNALFLYGSNNTLTLQAAGDLTVTGDVSNGIGMIGDSNQVTTTGTINVNGFQSAGIDLIGDNNVATIDGTINVGGDEASGVLIRRTASNTSNNNEIVLRGTITTTAPDAVAFRVQSGNSSVLHLSGTATANSGSGNVISIGTNANHGTIHLMQGANLDGHIRNDGSGNWGITFGRQANSNGQATADADPNFNINYDGHIDGTTAMNAQFVGGINHATGTQLSGTTEFNTATIGTEGHLTAGGVLSTGSFTNSGKLNVTGTGTIISITDISNDGLIETNAGFIATLDRFTNSGAIQSNTGTIFSINSITNDGLIANNTGEIVAFAGDLDINQTGIIQNLGGRLESEQGHVNVAGLLTSNGGQINAGQTVTVFDGGRLSGTPTITASLVDNRPGATMAPGNSIGTMTIVGNYQTNGTLEYEISHQNLPQDADLIRVQGGQVVINNATTYANRGTFTFEGETSTNADDYQIARRYTIIETDAPGDLNVVQRPKTTDNIDGRRIILRSDTDIAGLYTPNAQVYYAYIGRDASYASLGMTPNQQAIGAYLDSLLTLDDGSALGNQVQWIRDTLDLIPDENDVRAAYRMLSGEIYASVNPLILQEIYASQGRLAARLRNDGARLAFCNELGVPTSSGWTGWISGAGSAGQTHGSDNAVGYNVQSGGTQAVVGYGVDCRTMLGGFYEFTNMAFVNGDVGSAQTDLNEWGMFFSHHEDIAHFMLVGSGGNVANEIRRGISFGNTAIQMPIQQALTGDYSGSFASVYGETGFQLTWDWFTLRPFVGLGYTHVSQDGLTEEGGLLALRVQDSSVDSLRSMVGLDASALLFGNRSVSLDLRSMWMHDFLFGGTDSIEAGFDALPGSTFTVSGTEIGRDFAVLGAGLSLDLVPNRVRIGGGYDLIFNRYQTMNVGSGTLEVVW